MQVVTGYSLMEAVVAGPLRFYHPAPAFVPQFSHLSCQEELERFDRAQHQSVLELARLYDHAFELVGEQIATIFAIHAMLLEDPNYQDTARTTILMEGSTAEHASKSACDQLIETFRCMESPYMQARAADVRDISMRMLRALSGTHAPDLLQDGPAILVCTEFTPSQVITMDRTKLIGLVSCCGSPDSHAAALAIARGIPTLIGVDLDPAFDGCHAVLDGYQSRLYVHPASQTDRLPFTQTWRVQGRKTSTIK